MGGLGGVIVTTDKDMLDRVPRQPDRELAACAGAGLGTLLKELSEPLCPFGNRLRHA